MFFIGSCELVLKDDIVLERVELNDFLVSEKRKLANSIREGTAHILGGFPVL